MNEEKVISAMKKYVDSITDDCGIVIHGEAERLVVDSLEVLEVTSDKLAEARNLLSRAYSLLDDVHCGDTKTSIDIGKYLYGDEE